MIFEYILEQDRASIKKMIEIGLLNEHFSSQTIKEESVRDEEINDYHNLMAHDQWRRGHGGAIRQVERGE